MPVNPTYPGVYIEEIPSGVRTIRGVSTSAAVFIGTFERGLHNEAVRVLSLSDFEREYGGLDRDSEASYAVQQFFLNGGTEAWVIRVGHPGPADDGPPVIVPMTAATISLEDTVGGGGDTLLDVTAGRQIRGEPAENPGDWGNSLRLEVTYNTSANDTTFNLTVKEVQIEGDRTTVVQQEVFRNLTMQPNEANTAIEVVNEGSRLIQLEQNVGATPDDEDQPHTTGLLGGDIDPAVVFAGDLPVLAEIDDIAVTLQLGAAPSGADIGPIDLDFSDLSSPDDDPASFAAWAALFQERLRRAALDTTTPVPVALRPYLSGAVVTLLGDGSAEEPWRMHVQAGQGARPFLAEMHLVFTDTDAPNYGLDIASATHDGPQQLPLTGGANGTVYDPDTDRYLVPEAAFSGNPGARTGLYALDDVDLFNILCIPDAPRLGDDSALALYSEALSYVTNERAMLIVDIPQGTARIDQMETWLGENTALRAPNTAVYFPRTFIADGLNRNRPRSLASSGTIAGLVGAHRCAARRLEGPGRDRCASARGARPCLRHDRSGKRRAQSAGGQLSAQFPDLWQRLLGRAHHGRGRPDRLGLEIRSGSPHHAFHRGKSLPRHAVGGVRAERRTPLGANQNQRRRLHARLVPTGCFPGRNAV